ncbi:MAG: iron ABC transporter permease [Candidatus Promineifilaceae bacterium]|nr:iron ABC transporter permease [Candidatus Promineifilaceae bacterium]
MSWILRYRKILYLFPILFLALFYFYPLGVILSISFAPDGRIELSPLRRFIENGYYLRTLWFTVWQAVVSTLLVLLLAIPGAYVFARYRFRGKNTLRAFSLLPFVLPTVVVANAFLALLGPRGTVNEWLMNLLQLTRPPLQLQHTLWMILLAHIFFNYSVAMRIISSAWQNLSPDLGHAAQMLGASPLRVFRHVTLPLLRPSITAAAALVFIFCFTSFGVILLLGGPRFATIEVEIYRQAVNLFNLSVAAALALLQIVFTFILMWQYTWTQENRSHSLKLVSSQYGERPIRTHKDRLIVYSNLAIILLLLGLPLLALISRSFTGDDGLTLRFYQELFVNRTDSIFFVPPVEAVRNSTAYALVTLVLAVILGLISTSMLKAKNYNGILTNKSLSLGSLLQKNGLRLMDPLFMLPLATSAVTLGFGYIVALNKPPINLRQSIVLVPIAHTLVALPFVIRSLLPAMRRINPRLQEAASLLGAERYQVWFHVDWPLIRRALLVGAVFAFTISMGEFGATVFIARPNSPTMPVAIYRFLGQPGALNYGQALAMSSLLMLVCAVGFIAIERFRLGGEGEF